MTQTYLKKKKETMIWDWNESSDDAYAESIINIHDVELINIKHIPQCITNLV